MTMLEVFSLVLAAIFGWIAAILFLLRITDAVRDYARAMRAIQRIASNIDRDTISVRQSD